MKFSTMRHRFPAQFASPGICLPGALALALTLAACQPDANTATGDTVATAEPAIIDEAFTTPGDTLDNIDSPTVWHGPNGQNWVMSTAKSTHVILVNDASTGAELRRVGGEGTADGQLTRPNGVAMLGDILLVTERDNRRVQGFHLPDFTPVGTFGETELRKPYGIAVHPEGDGNHLVFITDNYETPEETIPPDNQLYERVKKYRVSVEGGRLRAQFVRSFGDTVGDGVLRKVESIMTDGANNRVLIAEELEGDSHIKVYDLDGRFTGELMGRGLFPQEAEGIALYACGTDAGYWISTDQGEEVNTFHVFDRMSLAHIGSFRGRTTHTTDGIWLTQQSFGPFPSGAIYAAHGDMAVSALSWQAIAAALDLRSDCRG
jgi:3-phytase